MVNIELRRTLKVYRLLIAVICLDAFLHDFVPSTIIRFLELLCVLNILYLCIKLRWIRRLRTLRKPVLLSLLAILSIGIIVRGDWSGNIKDHVLKFISPEGVWLYLSPFVILSLPNRTYFKEIIRLFYRASLLTIPLWAINYKDLIATGEKNLFLAEGIGARLPFLAGFLLALPAFFTRRQNLLIRFVWLAYFLLMLINARRNVSFSFALYGVIAYAFYLASKHSGKTINKAFSLFAVVVAGAFLVLNLSNLTSGAFKTMSQRADEDTRSGVTELFFLDYMKAPATDWIFGRGMDGTYYQPTVDEETGEKTDGRGVIETGYLNIMLKGGISYDVVVLCFLLGAIFRSFTRRDGIVSVYIGVFLCTYLIDLYSTSPVIPYSIRSLLFWFCITLSCAGQYQLSNPGYARLRKKVFQRHQLPGSSYLPHSDS